MSSLPQLLLPPDLSPQLLVSILERESQYRLNTNKLQNYKPYPKQAEFHAAGAIFRERLFLAGNRCGKTEAGAMECAMHLTGLYPQDWTGKRFEKPVRMWVSGVTGESSRDVVQAKLFGPPDRRSEWGSGTIPHASLDVGHISTGRGISGAIDMASIEHRDPTGHFNGWSSLAIKSYERGREKWQGPGLEVVWFDEEPPMDIYLEGLTRTNETGGIVFLTCTPLLGMSSVMMRFLHPEMDR
jgi:phage terminase large subunit-like protein